MAFSRSERESIRDALRRDLRKLRAPRGYLRAGYPNFPGLFGRDSLIAAWQVLREEPSFAKAALVRLAELQGKRERPRNEEEPGKILHEYYEPTQLWTRYVRKWRITMFWGQPYYGSVDATPLWLIVLGRYYEHRRDSALLDLLWPHAVAAYRWVAQMGDHDGDGFLDYQSHNRRALLHQAWKDSNELGTFAEPIAPVEVQGYAFAALSLFGRLAAERGDRVIAEDAERRAGALRRSFRAAFLLPQDVSPTPFFAFARDGKGRLLPHITSNPGHLLFSGILDADDARAVAKRLFADDLWTPFGLRTLSTNDPRFSFRSYHRGSIWPHDNWFFWMGLRMIGDEEGAARVRDALLNAYVALGKRIPELYGCEPGAETLDPNFHIVRADGGIQTPCYPQAWASGALLSMLAEEDT